MKAFIFIYNEVTYCCRSRIVVVYILSSFAYCRLYNIVVFLVLSSFTQITYAIKMSQIIKRKKESKKEKNKQYLYVR